MIVPLVAKPQYQEVGFTGGLSYYIGDINPHKHFYNMKPAGGLLFRFNLTDRHALRVNVNVGQTAAYDSDSEIDFNQNRNLHFRNNYIEAAGVLELNFFPYEVGNQNKFYTPYVFFGLGFVRSKPQAEYNDNWIDLRPLGTEGQGLEGYGDQYSGAHFIMPFGIGAKCNITGRFAVSAEWGFRKVFSDYFDDVSTSYVNPSELEENNGPLAATLADRSLEPIGPEDTNTGMQRGDSSKKDWYTYMGITFSVRLGNTRVKCPSAWN